MGRKFNHVNTSHNQASPYTMAISYVNFLQVSPNTPDISDIFAPTLLKAVGAFSLVYWPPGDSTSLLFWPKYDHVEHHMYRVVEAQLQATIEQVIAIILVHATHVSCRYTMRLCGKFLKCPYFKSLCRKGWIWVHCETLKSSRGNIIWCRYYQRVNLIQIIV